jgi:predicted SAM-dependent methyltransferase
MNPQPGFVHLDIDPNFPHLEIVCDLSKESIPLPDGSVSELLANHVIEHIPWRNLPFIVKEWARVIAPGGRLFLRTPDMEFICRTYLEGKTTPEWPGDEAAMVEVFGDCGPSQWAVIKLFSGQDYPSNFHYNCFDIKSMTQLLTRYGFQDVKRIAAVPVFSPGELAIEAFKL